MEEPSNLYEYTSGRWLWNEELRRAERLRTFNARELINLAAIAVQRSATDVVKFEKLGEGGFNRSFVLTMRDGFRMVARIPYPMTEPKHLLVGSEVATMDYLHSCHIPVPKVYAYSTTSRNPAGTEYIFMELVHGTNLGDIWFELGGKARIAVVRRLVELESRLFSLTFPASGSLYYSRDVNDHLDRIEVPSTLSSENGPFCIGPDTSLGMWYGKRLGVDTFRGPYKNAAEVLTAGAQKEIEYLSKYGRPLHPFQRLRRECVKYQRQCPSQHVGHLKKYLRVVPDLVPQHNGSMTRPSIRHPDLQPNNIFVSRDLEITGIIDWQHCTVLPLFLQAGIPGSLQNHGDDVSESLDLPRLPENFNDENEDEQLKHLLLLRKRQLHYNYVMETRKTNALHGQALTDYSCIMRRKLFQHASDPWEGDNVTLKSDLIELSKQWRKFHQSPPNTLPRDCPLEFTESEVVDTLRLATDMDKADNQWNICLDMIGVGPEGWVPAEQYEDAKQREQQLKADALKEAESDQERDEVREHWIFDDFDETEYM